MNPRVHSRLLITILVTLLLFLSAFLAAGCAGEWVKETGTLDTPMLDSGPISGRLENGVRSFLGIPYAAPPVGELRWKEPQPVEPWVEVRPCLDYGPSCPQPRSDWTGQLDVGETSEDCLYLNVWTPARTQQDRLPVMVWIHGGAFQTGSGSLPIYDGTGLASRGVVVVTINYRLGPLGFLAHPLLSEESPHGVSGNYGLLDQVAALEWVQRNIAAFGGDPGKVTVFGESAGGMSILYLMTSPLAEGLFQRAIVESGPLMELGLPAGGTPTLEEAERQGSEISRKLRCADAEDELAALRSVEPEKLMEAVSSDNPFTGPINLGPNVDGYLLPGSPLEAFSSGEVAQVPLLTGINADEGTIFAPDIPPEQYRLMVSFLYGDLAPEILARYPGNTPEQVKPALSRLITELGFAATARFTAESMSTLGTPSYLYHFTRIPTDPRVQGLGSFHGLEIMYVFGTLDEMQMIGLDDADFHLSEAMMTYWTSFAATGDPNAADLLEWPSYRKGEAPYIELGEDVRASSGFFDDAYQLALRVSGLQP
ncbi:carboxylesterase/lipase family protein [Candidatus Solincola sp.]|nr:carboxylesterase/lipase family protein [Actinomycetota bacterium]